MGLSESTLRENLDASLRQAASLDAVLCRVLALTEEDLEGLMAECAAMEASYEGALVPFEKRMRRLRKGRDAMEAVGLTPSDQHFVRRFLTHLAATSVAKDQNPYQHGAHFASRINVQSLILEMTLETLCWARLRVEVRRLRS